MSYNMPNIIVINKCLRRIGVRLRIIPSNKIRTNNKPCKKISRKTISHDEYTIVISQKPIAAVIWNRTAKEKRIQVNRTMNIFLIPKLRRFESTMYNVPNIAAHVVRYANSQYSGGESSTMNMLTNPNKIKMHMTDLRKTIHKYFVLMLKLRSRSIVPWGGSSNWKNDRENSL
jgi:hypothetical protein